MTITRKTGAGPVYGTTSVSAAYPTTPTLGDYFVYFVGFKTSNANIASNPNIATPSGWSAIGNLDFAGGYGSTLGADTGNVSIYAFGKESDGTESGTVLGDSGIWGDSMWGEIVPFGRTGSSWDIATATASDTSAGNLSLSFTDPGIAGGDHLLVGWVMPTNSDDGLKFSGEAFATTGLTFGAVTEVSEPNSAIGNDIAGLISAGPVATGTASASTLFTATAGGTTTNVRGGAVLVRLREILTNPPYPRQFRGAMAYTGR